MNPIKEADKLPPTPLSIINNLIIKAIDAPNKQSLGFVIVNGTHDLIKYDRAILFEIRKNKMELVNISGQTSINPYSELYQKLTGLANTIKDPSVPQMLNTQAFPGKEQQWSDYQKHLAMAVLWLPIFAHNQLILGLWLERWNVTHVEEPSKETLQLLTQNLLPGYGTTWSKFRRQFTLKPVSRTRQQMWIVGIAAALLASLLIRVPLRVVAPCEVVPKDPIVITAPLEGIVEKVVVKPGDSVQEGTPLVKYDDRVPLQEYKVAQNQVDIIQAQINRALSPSPTEKVKSSLEDLSILKLKLAKEKLALELADYNMRHITVKAPKAGTVMIDDPDEWSGKPVHIGEKIMKVIDLSKTKIKIWVPENDNIELDAARPLRIYLNIDPDKSREAKLNYIGNEVTLSEKHIPSFIAEANWVHPQSDEKPGLKGTAILYGQKVSLLYYLARKPWAFLRNTFGI